MKLSANMGKIRPSGTMAYFARVRELIREGRDIISLATGELHSPTPEHIGEAGVQAIREGQTKYTVNAGMRDLREAIARAVTARLGHRYTFEQVLVSNGSKQALFNALYAMCGPGDEVIILAPYYPSYPEQVHMAGATPVQVPTCRENGYQIDERELRQAVTSRTRGIIINSPNNPSGMVYNEQSLRAVAGVAREAGCGVISDDIYEAIVYPPSVVRHILQVAPDLADRTIVVGGFSKTYAMTGWRIGYALGPTLVIEAAGLVQSHVTNNASTISQYAALAALEERSDFQSALVTQLRENRDRAHTALLSMPGVVCPLGEGAFYLFPDVSGDFGATADGDRIETSAELASYLLEEHGVAVVPGASFGLEGKVRISYATNQSRLSEGLRRMHIGLEQIRR